MTRWWPICLTVLGFSLLGCTSNNATKENADNPKGSKPPHEDIKVERKPDFVISAAAFLQEFKLDKTAAHTKFENKVLDITGEVRSVWGHVGTYGLSLKAGTKEDDYFNVWVFDSEIEKVCKLSRGQKIKVIGVLNSSTTFTSVTDGRVTELEPSQTVLVSAQDLAREFEKSGADILKRAYDEKDIIVSGVIEDLREEFGRYRYAIMAGTAKTRVSVSVAEPRDFRELKVGQAVRLRGQDLFASEQQVKIQNGIVLPSK